MEIPRKRIGEDMMRKERRKLNNSGSTMVETLAAFTVLAIVLTMLFHIVSFCGRLRTMAVDSAKLQQMFLREAYKTEEVIKTENADEDTAFIKLTTYTGTGDPNADKSIKFTMVLDTSREDMMDRYYELGNQPEDEGYTEGFRLNLMGAKSYVCVDPIITEEELTRPVMMNFVYESPKVEEAAEP